MCPTCLCTSRQLHVVIRNGIVPGAATTVSLIADDIHFTSPAAR
jgi:hypothetical protein